MNLNKILPPLAAISVIFLIGSGTVTRIFVYEAFKIPAGSMSPTLLVGDQLFVAKYDTEPERGKVMVFVNPIPPNHDYVKRMVAIGGDTVEIRGGRLLLNGETVPTEEKGTVTFDEHDNGTWSDVTLNAYEETLGDNTYVIVHDDGAGGLGDFGPVTVPEGQAFFMGDNREHSYDSRSWGYVPYENLLGTADMIYWSTGPNGLRSDRLGREVR